MQSDKEKDIKVKENRTQNSEATKAEDEEKKDEKSNGESQQEVIELKRMYKPFSFMTFAVYFMLVKF